MSFNSWKRWYKERKGRNRQSSGPSLKMKSPALLANKRASRVCLCEVFAVIEGARMEKAEYVEVDLQNYFFDSYSYSEERTITYVFNFFGEWIHDAVNISGS